MLGQPETPEAQQLRSDEPRTEAEAAAQAKMNTIAEARGALVALTNQGTKGLLGGYEPTPFGGTGGLPNGGNGGYGSTSGNSGGTGYAGTAGKVTLTFT